MFDSLALSDVFQLIAVCAIIFIPLGYFIRHNLKNMRIYFLLAPKVRSNLKDRGSFSDFLNSDK